MCSRATSCRDLYKFRDSRGFRSVGKKKERCLNLFTSGESRERVKAERGSVKEGMLTCLLLVFVQLFERSLRLGIGIGVKS